MEQKRYEYDGMIHEVPDNGGAYVIFPWNIREEFGKGRLKVHAEFDSIPLRRQHRQHGREGRGRECMLHYRDSEINQEITE